LTDTCLIPGDRMGVGPSYRHARRAPAYLLR
jgi:hypothetical protein